MHCRSKGYDRSSTAGAWRVAATAAGIAATAPTTAPATGAKADKEIIPEPAVYDVNDAGLTYGAIPKDASPYDEPDLILAEATNGRVGYVYGRDLEAATPGSDVSNPAEADAHMAQVEAGAFDDVIITIPVYEADGTTVIGEFIIGDQ